MKHDLILKPICRSTPNIEGQGPSARADLEIAFDIKNSQLIFFSGWGASWAPDTYTLDISALVGPSYTLNDLFPRMGPVTGGTDLELTGLDFVVRGILHIG